MLTRRTTLAGLTVAPLSACVGLLPAQMPPPPRLVAAPELAQLPGPAPREFRAAWVATVANIDWPSQPGLSAAQQQAEMRVILDRAVALKLNAIILQVRTSADAFYPSELEPWSEYLSGTQGVSPGYDPLALWIAEAHQRGLELHAWFNPFRARQSSAKSALAANHLGRVRPDWVKTYGDQLWIDPGEAGAAEHTLAVFADVLKRYDLDGIHIDDYFYPYPLALPANAAGRAEGSKEELDFPDAPAWQRYSQSGGALARADWRRQNVNQLIERLYAAIKAQKPWVQLGVSPFGLGKPGQRPSGIVGFSQYDKLYADVELWLARGWLDYLVPQLYWPRAQKAQAFGPLLSYWLAQNPQRRHIWAGLYSSRVLAADNPKPDSWPVEEISGQIELQRELAPSSGHVHFSMVALSQNRRGLADHLSAAVYPEAALVPATPWVAAAPVDALPSPSLQWSAGDTQQPQLQQLLQLRLDFAAEAQRGAAVALWLRYGGGWQFQLGYSGIRIPAAGLTALVLAPLQRNGVEGERVGFRVEIGRLK
ncbi:glycoside hydrolase family 10 protein [Roseateles sp.]|uniref:glycoside hydrolase family 10 protein n=1 Tax=Roseateles sp. TaxID=1971397 RepID=UPI00286B6F9D|nr:family 10 glycosylhydrolase [Roseateles sp.]